MQLPVFKIPEKLRIDMQRKSEMPHYISSRYVIEYKNVAGIHYRFQTFELFKKFFSNFD